MMGGEGGSLHSKPKAERTEYAKVGQLMDGDLGKSFIWRDKEKGQDAHINGIDNRGI